MERTRTEHDLIPLRSYLLFRTFYYTFFLLTDFITFSPCFNGIDDNCGMKFGQIEGRAFNQAENFIDIESSQRMLMGRTHIFHS